MKKTIFLSVLPLISFLAIMIIRDEIMNYYVDHYLYIFASDFLFPIFLLIFFFEIKYIRYISFGSILVMLFRSIIASFNTFEMVVSFDTIPPIRTADMIQQILICGLIVISFFQRSSVFAKVFLFVLAFGSIISLIPVISIGDFIFGPYETYSVLPISRRRIYDTIQIMSILSPIFLYYALFKIKHASKQSFE